MTGASTTPRGDGRRLAGMLLLLVILVMVVAYLDRSLRLREMELLRGDVQTLQVQLANADHAATSLRSELLRVSRETDGLRGAAATAAMAVEALSGAGARAHAMTPHGGHAAAWLVIPAAAGTAYVVARELPRAPEGLVLLVQSGASREAARLVPAADGRAAVAFDVGDPAALHAVHVATAEAPGAILSWEAAGR
jgi:hypothetical protein